MADDSLYWASLRGPHPWQERSTNVTLRRCRAMEIKLCSAYTNVNRQLKKHSTHSKSAEGCEDGSAKEHKLCVRRAVCRHDKLHKDYTSILILKHLILASQCCSQYNHIT